MNKPPRQPASVSGSPCLAGPNPLQKSTALPSAGPDNLYQMMSYRQAPRQLQSTHNESRPGPQVAEKRVMTLTDQPKVSLNNKMIQYKNNFYLVHVDTQNKALEKTDQMKQFSGAINLSQQQQFMAFDPVRHSPTYQNTGENGSNNMFVKKYSFSSGKQQKIQIPEMVKRTETTRMDAKDAYKLQQEQFFKDRGIKNPASKHTQQPKAPTHADIIDLVRQKNLTDKGQKFTRYANPNDIGRKTQVLTKAKAKAPQPTVLPDETALQPIISQSNTVKAYKSKQALLLHQKQVSENGRLTQFDQ